MEVFNEKFLLRLHHVFALPVENLVQECIHVSTAFFLLVMVDIFKTMPRLRNITCMWTSAMAMFSVHNAKIIFMTEN